jgi:hypothetical protein
MLAAAAQQRPDGRIAKPYAMLPNRIAVISTEAKKR